MCLWRHLRTTHAIPCYNHEIPFSKLGLRSQGLQWASKSQSQIQDAWNVVTQFNRNKGCSLRVSSLAVCRVFIRAWLNAYKYIYIMHLILLSFRLSTLINQLKLKAAEQTGALVKLAPSVASAVTNTMWVHILRAFWEWNMQKFSESIKMEMKMHWQGFKDSWGTDLAQKLEPKCNQVFFFHQERLMRHQR